MNELYCTICRNAQRDYITYFTSLLQVKEEVTQCINNYICKMIKMSEVISNAQSEVEQDFSGIPIDLRKEVIRHDEGYNPDRSTTTTEALRAWLAAPITGNLLEVPGIGEGNVLKLATANNGGDPICTSYELFGKFFLLKSPGVLPVEHCDRFWFWLKGKGIISHRAAIVQACAEKLNLMMPGLYDGNSRYSRIFYIICL